MVRKIPTMATSAGAMQLQAMAERLQTQGELRNPIIEQALMKAAREQSQAAVETAEQAAGLTGAAQVGMAQMAQAQAMGQAMMQAQAQRVQNMQATIGLQAQLRGQVASLEEQRYQTNLQHQQFMAQLEQQAKDARRNRVAGLVGGLAAAASGPLSAALAPEELVEEGVKTAAEEGGGGLFGMIKSGLGGLKEGFETFQALQGQPYIQRIETLADSVAVYVDRGEEVMPQIIGLLRENGIAVKTMALSRPSLQDVFLKHTGSTIRDREASAAEQFRVFFRRMRAASAPMPALKEVP